MTHIDLSPTTARRIRIAIFTCFFMQGLCFSSWASRIPDIKNALELNDAAWGTILLMMPLGQFIGMIFSGSIIARLGSKRVLPVALGIYALMLSAVGLAQSEYMLLGILVCFGFVANFSNISINTQGITLERYYQRPIMSTFHGGWSFAGLAGGTIGLLMTTLKINPTLHFILVTILILSGILYTRKYLQPDLKKESDTGNQSLLNVKPEKFLFLLGLVGFCGMAAEGSMSDWNGLYLRDVVGVADYLTPLGLMTYMLTMASGRFVMDKVSQRYGRRRVLQFCGCAIFTGLSLTVIYPGFITSLIAFMIVGFGTSGVVPTIFSTVGQKTKLHPSLALTIVSSVSFLGFLLGPPVIGYISQLTNLRVSYALIALFGLSVALLSSNLKILKGEEKTAE